MGQEIEEVTGIDGEVGAVEQVDCRFTPPEVGGILDVVYDQGAVVGQLHQRCEGQDVVIRAIQLVEEHHQKRPPPLAAAPYQVKGRRIDLLQELILIKQILGQL